MPQSSGQTLLELAQQRAAQEQAKVNQQAAQIQVQQPIQTQQEQPTIIISPSQIGDYPYSTHQQITATDKYGRTIEYISDAGVRVIVQQPHQAPAGSGASTIPKEGTGTSKPGAIDKPGEVSAKLEAQEYKRQALENLLKSPTAEFASQETAQKAYEIATRTKSIPVEEVKAHLKPEVVETKEEIVSTKGYTPEQLAQFKQDIGLPHIASPFETTPEKEKVLVEIEGKKVPFGKQTVKEPGEFISGKFSEMYETVYSTKIPYVDVSLKDIDVYLESKAKSTEGQKIIKPVMTELEKKTTSPFFVERIEAKFTKGFVGGLVEKPGSSILSFGIGAGAASGFKVLASAKVLTKGISAEGLGAKITPLNIVGTGVGITYGATVATRIGASKEPIEELGKITSTEILPMGLGAKTIYGLKTPSGISELIKSEEATSYFGSSRGRAPFRAKIESPGASKMNIEVTHAAQRTLNIPRRAPTRQILETARPEVVSSVRTVDLTKLRAPMQESMSELLKQPAGKKITAGVKYQQESGLSKTLTEYKYGQRRGSREKVEYTREQLDPEYMTEKQIAARVKEPESVTAIMTKQESGLAKTLEEYKYGQRIVAKTKTPQVTKEKIEIKPVIIPIIDTTTKIKTDTSQKIKNLISIKPVSTQKDITRTKTETKVKVRQTEKPIGQFVQINRHVIQITPKIRTDDRVKTKPEQIKTPVETKPKPKPKEPEPPRIPKINLPSLKEEKLKQQKTQKKELLKRKKVVTPFAGITDIFNIGK